MPSFGERLSELRKEKGLSQQELADLFEVSKSAIAMYETDRREPDNETLKKFATFFYVSTDYLLGRTDERRPAEQIIEDALIDDPELKEFWQELKERPDLQLLFKQTKDLSPESIRRIIKIIKAIEDEEASET